MLSKKIFFFFFFFLLLYSCQRSRNTIVNTSSLYDVYVRSDDAADEYIVRVSDLSKGKINPVENGVKVSKEVHYGLTVRGDKYYYLNEKTHQIKQYEIVDEVFLPIDSVSATKIEYLESILWISDDTLLMSGLHDDLVHPAYALVDVKNMTLIKEGIIEVPHPEQISWTTIGFMQYRDGQLFLAFYSKPREIDLKNNISKTHIVTMDFPTMDCVNIQEVNRPGRTLNDNRYQPSSIQDENGNIYFLSSGSDRLLEAEVQGKGLPSGIQKINKGEKEVDPDFFINTLEAPSRGYVYGIWYLGKDKAIIKCDVPERIQTWDDYDDYAYIYYEVDLKTSAFFELDLPIDRGWYLDNVLIDNDIAYIANKSEASGNYIWIYNPTDRTIVRGAEVEGNFDHFRRINKIK